VLYTTHFSFSYGSLKVFDDDWLIILQLFYIVNFRGTECMNNQFPEGRGI